MDNTAEKRCCCLERLRNLFCKICHRIKWRINFRFRNSKFFYRSFYKRLLRKETSTPVLLNLGCNIVYMENWINVDVDWRVKADIYADIRDLSRIFPGNSVDTILMSHVISYFSLEAARRFFRLAYSILKPGGKLVFEFPDIKKLATSFCEIDSIDDDDEFNRYLELLRPVFACIPEEKIGTERYDTYVFAWSAMHMKKELSLAGFREIEVLPPEYHGKQVLRDTRIECCK